MFLWVLAPYAAMEWGTSTVPTARCSSVARGNGFSKAKPQEAPSPGTGGGFTPPRSWGVKLPGHV